MRSPGYKLNSVLADPRACLIIWYPGKYPFCLLIKELFLDITIGA